MINRSTPNLNPTQKVSCDFFVINKMGKCKAPKIYKPVSKMIDESKENFFIRFKNLDRKQIKKFRSLLTVFCRNVCLDEDEECE